MMARLRTSSCVRAMELRKSQILVLAENASVSDFTDSTSRYQVNFEEVCLLTVSCLWVVSCDFQGQFVKTGLRSFVSFDSRVWCT